MQQSFTWEATIGAAPQISLSQNAPFQQDPPINILSTGPAVQLWEEISLVVLPSPTPIARGATFNVIMIVGISQEESKTLHNTSTQMSAS